MIKLFPHQQAELEATKDMNRVAYYHDMGLGKTYTGAEKMIRLGADINLVICQKSKVDDWIKHLKENYVNMSSLCFNLTNKAEFTTFMNGVKSGEFHGITGVINYELAFRRPQLKDLRNFTLMLDESQMIQNETAKRSKFILSLKPDNVILLSGTPTGGKYEKLYSQMKLLGWKISKTTYWNQYIDYEIMDMQGFPIKVVKGYKNVNRLKAKMRSLGCRFLRTEDVFNLPQQTFNRVAVPATKEYRKLRKTGLVEIDGETIVGDTVLTRMLYERMLCGSCNKDKLNAVKDVLESTEDRVIIFYNFTAECEKLEEIAISLNRSVSVVSGQRKDLKAYEKDNDSVTLIQYQAGATGLNLQKANKVIYFTPPLSSELFEQSKKRIHRIGQGKPCFYYMLVCKNSVEVKIYETLEQRKDFTEKLFEALEK